MSRLSLYRVLRVKDTHHVHPASLVAFSNKQVLADRKCPQNLTATSHLKLFHESLCMPSMKMCFSASNLFLIEIVVGKGEKCGLSPSHRSCVEISRKGRNNSDSWKQQGPQPDLRLRRVRPLTTDHWPLQLIEGLILWQLWAILYQI